MFICVWVTPKNQSNLIKSINSLKIRLYSICKINKAFLVTDSLKFSKRPISPIKIHKITVRGKLFTFIDRFGCAWNQNQHQRHLEVVTHKWKVLIDIGLCERRDHFIIALLVQKVAKCSDVDENHQRFCIETKSECVHWILIYTVHWHEKWAIRRIIRLD